MEQHTSYIYVVTDATLPRTHMSRNDCVPMLPPVHPVKNRLLWTVCFIFAVVMIVLIIIQQSPTTFELRALPSHNEACILPLYSFTLLSSTECYVVSRRIATTTEVLGRKLFVTDIAAMNIGRKRLPDEEEHGRVSTTLRSSDALCRYEYGKSQEVRPCPSHMKLYEGLIRRYGVALETLRCYASSTNYALKIVNVDTDPRVNKHCKNDLVSTCRAL